MEYLECTDESIGVLLADYEAGWLSAEPENERKILRHMQACEYCRVSYERMVPVWRMLRAHPEIVTQVNRELKHRSQMTKAAVLLLLIMGGLWGYPRYSEYRLKKDYAALVVMDAPSYENEIMRPAGRATIYRQEGMMAFHKRNFVTAADKLAMAVREEPDNPLIAYLLGLSCMQIGKYDEAIVALESSRQRAQGALQADAQWYLGNMYLKVGKIEEARKIFEGLLTADMDEKAKAQAMLERMKEVESRKWKIFP